MDRTALEEILASAVTESNASKGNIQLLNPITGKLQIIANIGFGWRFLSHFDSVHEGQAACGTALETGQRIVVEDVAASPVYDARSRAVMLEAQARACQSTPLRDQTGKVIGMLSTHRRTAGAFDDVWSKIDDLAAHTVRAIEQTRMTPGSLSWSTARSRVLIESVRQLVEASSSRQNLPRPR